MPELPEAEVGRRLAHHAAVGRTITDVHAADDPIVFLGLTPDAIRRSLTGRRVTAAGRRGKYIWLELDQRPWPVFHFGMTGRFDVYDDPRDRPTYCKIELTLSDGGRLAMRNPRRLGRIRLLEDPLSEPPVSRLGFDVLTDLPSKDRLAAALARRRGPIKAVLLDQTLFAGVGNWIADEVLYQARIDPHRKAAELSPEQVGQLRAKLKAVVAKAVEVDADDARFPRTWLFHHRWGRNPDARTARGEPIAHATIAGRTTAWAPGVQT